MDAAGTLLRAVAAGAQEPTARLFVPGPTLAFGRLDAREAGFDAACAAAISHGFVPLVRHAGGRAAAYHDGCVVFDLVTANSGIATDVEQRFAATAELLVAALSAIGVPACVGELPGEFCPGRFSLHAGGIKLSGIAQRSVVGASLVTAAIAVTGGDRLREVLTDVYGELGFDWEPATAGSADAVAPGLGTDLLLDALAERLSAWGA